MKKRVPTQKAIAFIATFALVFSQILSLPVANAANILPLEVSSDGPIYDLVVLVVDTEIENDGNHVGLKNQYPDLLGDASDLGLRVTRYAEDLSKNNELTDTKIIFFDKGKDSVVSLANALENIYVNGDNSAGHPSELKGVVLIGDIPLPVVNKKGNRYISLFPYTDFSEKAYSYNDKKKSFERNSEVVYPKPEIWHGVIRPPSDDFEGREKMAQFFDKNHLYYSGEKAFSEFGRKLFFGDLTHEEEKMNSDMYRQYLQYLEAFEDVAYFRYNKFWAKELSGKVEEALKTDGELKLNDENPLNQQNGDVPGFEEILSSGDNFADTPDIYSKQIIDSILAPYYKLATKYLSKVNDWTEYTGRYKSNEVDSVAELINIKDEYTKYYLRSLNDALEKKVNEVVELIQEPISIVDYSTISGNFSGEQFKIGIVDGAVEDAAAAVPPVESFDFQFNYNNEANQKTYINGIDLELLDTPKQCSVFLGSTKSSYYDENLNFNPKAVDGVYSILVRALRSNDIKTAAPLYTAGVNTRLLSTTAISDRESELAQATDGAYAGNVNEEGVNETGAIIEATPKYGISAFLMSPFYGDYKNPWELLTLEPGDVITAINGRKISYEYTFEQAVESAAKTVESVLDSINDNKVAENLSAFPYQMVAYDEPPEVPGPFGAPIPDPEPDPNFPWIETYNNAREIVNAQRLKNTKVNRVAGIMEVEFYKGAQKFTKTISFTIGLDENGLKYPSAHDPAGGESGSGFPEVVVLFNTELPEGFDWDDVDNNDDVIDGAIFSLYQNRTQGFSSGAYDSSAGCNAGSTIKNSDRCLPLIASMPVLDPAGSTGLVKMEIPQLFGGKKVELKFPENVKKNVQGINSDRAVDFIDHVDSFQVPKNYQYEDIDEVYYDSCYVGYPSIGGLENDSNPYYFPLDPIKKLSENIPADVARNRDINLDFYGKLIESFGNFVSGKGPIYEGVPGGFGVPAQFGFGYLADEMDLVAASGDQDQSEFSPRDKLWLGWANMDASQVILDNNDGRTTTLKEFSDAYGLFDGVDNNINGIVDYEWLDQNDDGVYETKAVDIGEANPLFGLPSGNMQLIARKLLSHTSTYFLPAEAIGAERDRTLRVVAHEEKSISSMIVHDEPTMETIAMQLESVGTNSLPIDNPRYVAFQSEPNTLPEYPEPQPINGNVDVEAILGGLDLTPYYRPGRTVKIDYANAFEAGNLAELNAEVFAIADKLAGASGSYRIMSPNAQAEDYDSEEGRIMIKNKILDDYLLTAINSLVDQPFDGFELEEAETKKIHDALRWKTLNIDEKHEYILKYYLNDSPDFNAYVNDNTLYPAEPEGYEEALGYEGAYMVINSEDEESIDFSFNKDVPEEKGNAFDPIEQAMAAADAQVAAEANPNQEEEDGFQFVWLDQFFKELDQFLNAFTTVPKFEDMCVNLEDEDNAFGGEQVRGDNNGQPVEEAVQGLVARGDGNNMEIYTYTYLEIEGRSELLEVIKKQQELFIEGELKEGGDDVSGEEGGGSGDEVVDGESEGGGGAIERGTSENEGDEAEGSENSDEISNGDDNGGGVDEDPVAVEELLSRDNDAGGDNAGSTSLDGEIKAILSGARDVGHAVESEGPATTSSNDDEEIGGGDGASNGEDGGEGEDNGAGDQEEVEETEHWYDYYIDTKYYQKYLDGVEAKSSRLVAENFSDRMLVFIPDEQNPFVDAEENEETKYFVSAATTLRADGESLMQIQAHVYDADGHLETDKLRVKFEILDINVGSENIVTFENGDSAVSENGVATVYLRSGVKTGEFLVVGHVINADGRVNNNYQVPSKTILLTAGEAAKVDINADTNVLVANNISKTTVTVTLKDENGNTVNDALSNITVFINGLGYIDEKIDQNLAAVGVQLAVFDGQATFELYAKNMVGPIEVVALVTDMELEDAMIAAGNNYEELDFDGYIGAKKEFSVVERMELKFKLFDANFAELQSLRADGAQLAHIGVELVADGDVVDGYNGKIDLKLLSGELGTMATRPDLAMAAGRLNSANINFKASKTAGRVEILAEIPGFVSETFRFDSLAGAPQELLLTASATEIYTQSEQGVTLTAKIVDKEGNVVTTANGVIINFTTTDSTKEFVTLEEINVPTVKGVALVKVRGGDISGMANLMANAPGLAAGNVSLKVKKHLDSASLSTLNPRALYISLLGGAFGNIKNTENLANSLLYQGEVEAVSSITASPEGKRNLFSLDPYGKLEIIADTIDNEVKQSTDSFPYQKVLLSDGIEGVQLAEIFIVPKADSSLKFYDRKTELSEIQEGILVKDLSLEGTDIVIEEREDGIYILEDADDGKKTKAVVDKFGRIKIVDTGVSLRLPDELDEITTNDFALIIQDQETPIAAFVIREKFVDQNGDRKGINVLKFEDARQNFVPGIYLKLATDNSRYDFAKALTRFSTGEVSGLYMVDSESELDIGQRPGFAQTSLEEAPEKFGLGFESDNKHMLLFTAGSSVGESNNLYASDVGIVFGDPMVRVKKDMDDDNDGDLDLISEASGFTKDIGQNIYSGQGEIAKIVQIDYNADEREDLLLIYEDGLVRLLENQESNSHFKDRGYILNVVGGTFSASRIDLDNDGFDDLIVGTKESCKANEQCVSVFRNNEGSFERESLNLAIEGKIYEMKSADMNGDDCEDLVTSDSASNIRIFNNKKVGGDCMGLNTNYVYSQNFGYRVEPGSNLADDLYINYPGFRIPGDDPNITSDDNVVMTITLDSSEPSAAQREFAEAGEALQEGALANPAFAATEASQLTYAHDFRFLPIKLDQQFGPTTSKNALDVNGQQVVTGDKVKYTITLRNNGGAVNNLMISDITPGSLTLDLASLKCVDADCAEGGGASKPRFAETGMSLRSQVIWNINVPANGVRTIEYEMTINQVSKIHFDVGNDFTVYPSDNEDGFPDVLVKPELNPDNSLNYIYSAVNGGVVGYKKFNKQPEAANNDNLLAEMFAKAGLPNPLDLAGIDPNADVPESAKQAIQDVANTQTQDKDYNGCIDSWQSASTSYKNGAEAVSNAVEGAISALRCSGGGCLPNPYNRVFPFLAPNWLTPGIAVFALGVPVIGMAPLYPSSAPSTFRLYVTPTTSLGVGISVCSGPSTGHTSPCYAFAVPGGVPGLCDGIRDSIDSAVASVPNSVVNPDLGMSTVVSDGGDAADTKTLSAGDEMLPAALRDEKGESPFSAAATVNIRIPGFPSVVTNWLDKEIDEIYNKLLDPIKFYLILPDIGGLFSMAEKNANEQSNSGFYKLHDFLSTLNRLPILQIEGKEIVIKIPTISKNQIEKYRYQYKLWIEHLKKERDEKIAFWNCDGDPEKKSVCDKIFLDIQDLISSVQKLLDLLDRIENLPREILTWRDAEAKYANQIICYLDAVMGYTGGYIHRQQKIIESWIKAAQDVIRTFKDWKILLDAVIDYQQSCDQCRNDRFSDLGLLLNVFIALPDLPVIPMPKLPDVVVDLSQIKTGVKITWPDVTFKPQPILLPDLPTITLPDIIPSLTIEIPGFDVPDFPDFVLPDLPDLPPLPLPQLPDIPRPPRIPSIPHVMAELVANLKPIFKILCLLKNGVVPVPEGGLATEIETLTQPSVQVVLPLIKKLAIQLPEIQYDYVKEIRVTGKLNFDVKTDFIYDKAEEGSEIWNDGVQEMVKEINKYTQAPYGEVLSKAIQNAVDKAKGELEEAVKNDAIETEDGDDVSALPDKYHLVATQKMLESDDPLLNRSIADIESGILEEVLPQNEGMDQLAELRNSLIAYSKSVEAGGALIKNMDEFSSFDKVIVDSGSIKKVAEITKITDSENHAGGEKVLAFSPLGEQAEEMLLNDVEESKRVLLAANIDADGGAADAGGGGDAGGTGKPAKGFYIVGDGGINENVINYTAELNAKTNVIFIDADIDRDTDIIYTMGGDLFFKENYKNDRPGARGELIVGLNKNSVSDFVNPVSTRVEGVASNYTGNKKADLTWKGYVDPAQAGVVGYEIEVLKGLLTDTDRRVYLALNDKNYTPDEEYEAVFILDNPAKPTISLDLPNGNYFAQIYALNKDGERSNPSEPVLLSPQICADSEAPLPSITETEYEISVFKTLEIDASNSFDPDGEIAEYYLEKLPYANGDKKLTPIPDEIWSDANNNVDSSGDGNKSNDKTNPLFKIGPFVNEGDVGRHEFILHIVDTSGRSSNLKLRVEVTVPKITLDATMSRTLKATGLTTPATDNMPFSLMRSRYVYRVVEQALNLVPVLTKVITTEAGADNKYRTDANGDYLVGNFSKEDVILVQNAAGEVVAEVNGVNGNIGNIRDGYQVEVEEASEGKPMVLVIKADNGTELGRVYVIANPNVDVKIWQQLAFDKVNTSSMYGVNVSDLEAEDEFSFKSLGANDPSHPGGALLLDSEEQKQLAIIDSSGNILPLENTVKIQLKKNNFKTDPLILEMMVRDKVVAELYISALIATDRVQIVGPNDVPNLSPNTFVSTEINSGGVAGGAVGTGIKELFDKGIIEGQQTDFGFEYKPAQLINRAEFVKVVLKMLCIIPGEDSYKDYASGKGYSDIEFTEDLIWYYAYVKEATKLKLVEGYLGEVSDVNGLSPFRPDKTVTRAEAVKVILQALELKGVVDLSSLDKNAAPWHAEYMKAAQDITPYLKENVALKNNFIVTPEEAKEADLEMSFAELTEMALRVLDIYNCFELDEDNDGMGDFCEAKYDIDDPQADEDEDGLINKLECLNDLDPTDEDTDQGGVFDGPEFNRGTNALNPADDLPGSTVKEQEREVVDGVYLVPAECNTCPCNSTFVNGADILPGDTFFTVISNKEENYFFSKSEEVKIEKIK